MDTKKSLTGSPGCVLQITDLGGLQKGPQSLKTCTPKNAQNGVQKWSFFWAPFKGALKTATETFWSQNGSQNGPQIGSFFERLDLTKTLQGSSKSHFLAFQRGFFREAILETPFGRAFWRQAGAFGVHLGVHFGVILGFCFGVIFGGAPASPRPAAQSTPAGGGGATPPSG